MSNPKSLEFKGTVAGFSILNASLRSTDLAELAAAMAEHCGDSPDFFNADLVVLDVDALVDKGLSIDWPGLVALLRRHRLNPVAVRHADRAGSEAIQAAGLALAEEVESQPRKAAPPPPPPAPVAEVAPPPPPPPAEPVYVPTAVPAMVVDRTIRSGQQLYARHTDLVALAMVNPGAEVVADGNVHVYAPLRGRAVAGAAGNTSARILTTSFEAELVSIAGVFRPLEPGTPPDVVGKPAQVRLVTDAATGKQTLLIEPLRIG